MSIVLAGLAVGNFPGGHYADRFINPLRVYGLLEVTIGVLGLLTAAAASLVQAAYAGIHSAFIQGQSKTQTMQLISLVRMALTFVVSTNGCCMPRPSRHASAEHSLVFNKLVGTSDTA